MGSIGSKQNLKAAANGEAVVLPKSYIFTRGSYRLESEFRKSIPAAGESIWEVRLLKQPTERYLMKQLNKYQLHNHRKVELALRELQVLKGSNSRNVIKLLHAFQDENNLYSIYEYIQGPSLKQLLRNRIFEEGQTKFTVCSIILILEEVHKHGYVLSDLNPDRLLYDVHGNRVVLAQLMSLNRAGQYCHSNLSNYHYCAPEVLMMDELSFEADFYSLGLLTFEMMTQRKAMPEELSNRRELVKQAVSISKSDLPEGWSPEAADFLIRLVVKAPEYRLGRLGSYQLRKHPWLLNFDWTELSASTRRHFPSDLRYEDELPSEGKPVNTPLKEITDHPLFQHQFQQYR